MKTFKIGGVHPSENKLSATSPIRQAGLPKQAVFSLYQHIGAPAKAIVAKGDVVKVGTLLAEADGFVSAPIYSSVSGKITGREKRFNALVGRPVDHLVIENDFKYEKESFNYY